MIIPLLLWILVIALGGVLLNALKPERRVAVVIATGIIIAGVIGVLSLLVGGTQRLL
jgi:hypothetical protein